MANRSPRLTVFAIAISGLFAFFGTFIGASWLAAMWGITLPWDISFLYRYHPYLQLFGFVYIFIMGVSYTFVPRFKNRTISPRYASYLTLALFLAGLASSFIVQLIALILLAVAGILHFMIVVRLVRRPAGYLAITEYYFLASSAFLSFSMVLMLLREVQGSSGFSFSLIQLLLLGFPALMIFGVELRTVHFRLAELQNTDAAIALILFVAAIAISAITSLFAIESLTFLSSILALTGGLMYLRSFQIFKDLPAATFGRMTDKDKKRYVYFTRSIRFASLWLIAGLAVGLLGVSSLLYSQNLPFAFRDSFIHILAVGFIGSTIVGYAPILLPSIIAAHAPHKGLSFLPLYLLSIGNLVRVIGSVLQDVQVNFWPAALSGPLILAAMAHFMFMVHRLREEKTQENKLIQLPK